MSPQERVFRTVGKTEKLQRLTLSGIVAINQWMPAIPVERYPDVPPYSVVTNDGAERALCPEESSFAILQFPGIGNTMVGVHASHQTEKIVEGDEATKEAMGDVCYMGFVYGSEYNVQRNTDELHELIAKNNLRRVVIFAHSFGGMAVVDILNEYHRRWPDDTTEFALVLFSSPAEIDDLQLFSRISTEMLSRTQLGKGLVYSMTLGSILGQGDKSIIDGQVWQDSGVAASRTPPHTLQDQIKKLVDEGMNKLHEDLDIPVLVVFDTFDKIVNAERAIPSTERRIGRKIIFIAMHHTDHRMDNHAALWWDDNLRDYVPPVTISLEMTKEQLDKKAVARLAELATQGRVNLTITVPQPEGGP